MNSPGENSNGVQNSQEQYGTLVTSQAAVNGAVGRYAQSMDTIATRTHGGSTEDVGIRLQEGHQHQEPELSDTRGNYSMPASQLGQLSELLPLQSQEESRNHYAPGWAVTQEEEGKTSRNEDLSNFGDEPYQRSSLYQDSSNGLARDSIRDEITSHVEGRFLDGRPDQQIFRHDSNDPSAEMLQQPPAMYVEAYQAPRQMEGSRYQEQESQRTSEAGARDGSQGPSGDYADSGPSYGNNGQPGGGAAGFGAGFALDGRRRLGAAPGQRYYESRSQSDASNALTYTNTLSGPASNHCGSLIVSSAVLEGTNGNNQRTQQLYHELEQLQCQDRALDEHMQNPFGQQRNEDASADRRLNAYLSLQSQERPALRQRSPYGAAGGDRRQLELVTSPAQTDVNGSTVIIDNASQDAGAGQGFGGVLDQGQYLSSDTFLPRDEGIQHASLRRPSPTPNRFPAYIHNQSPRGRSPTQDSNQLPDQLYQESQENQESGAENGQLEGLLAAAAARRDSRGLREANQAYGENRAAKEVDLDDRIGTQTSSALGYSIGTGQGAGIRSVAQVTSHLNRSLAILVKKKQPIDLGNYAPKAQTYTQREVSPEEHTLRSKSISHNYNRKYCINKLFKQATGVPLEHYRKAQEYRQSVEKIQKRASVSTPPGAAKRPSGQSQTKPKGSSLRIKRSRSRSSPQRSRRSGASRSASVKRAAEMVQQEGSHIVTAPSEAKVSKIERYKQIEKQLAQAREIEEEARWHAEQYARRAEEELQQQRIQRDLADQVERERFHVIEAERQQQFVAETVEMLKRFESDHPHLEFTGTLAEKLAQQQHYQMTDPAPRRQEEGRAEEVKPYVGLRTKSPEGGSGDHSRGHMASEMLRHRQRAQGDTQRYGDPTNTSYRSRFEATGNSGWTTEPQLLTDHYGEQTQGAQLMMMHQNQQNISNQESQDHGVGHYVSMMSIGAQAKPSTAEDGSNAGPLHHIQGKYTSNHHASNFTLGHQDSVEHVASGRPMDPEQRHPLRNANDAQAITPYSLAQDTCNNSQRSILRLQGMLHEQNQVLDSLSYATSTKQALSSSFAWNQNESLLGINRSEDTRTAEVPASIHRGGQQDSRRGSGRNSKSTTSLRTKGQRAERAEAREPAGQAAENEQVRHRYGNDLGPAPAVRERSRSRPDTVPSRGPTVTDYPSVLGSGDRGASPSQYTQQRASSPIGNMELKSQFGRRQQLSGTRAEAQPRELTTQFILPPTADKSRGANQSRSSLHPVLRLKNTGPSAGQHNVVVYHMEQEDSVQYLESGHQAHVHDLQAAVGSDESTFEKRSRSSGNNARSKSREQRRAEYANNLRLTQLEVQHCLQNLNQSLNKSLTSTNKPNTFEAKENATKATEAMLKAVDATTAAGDYQTQANRHKGQKLTKNGSKGHRQFISLEQGRNQKLSLAQQEGSRIIYLDKEQYNFDASNQTHLTKTQSESTLAVSQQEHDANDEGQHVSEATRNRQDEQWKPQSRSKSKTSLNMRQLLNHGVSEQTGSADQQFPRPSFEKMRSGSTRGQAPAKPEKPKLDEARAHKKPKGSKRQRDLQKLMALQVRQAQMLTDLLQQKSVLDSVADESELRSDGLQSQAIQTSGTQGTMRTVRSGQELLGGQSVSQKQTMDLIQAVYKQMERINQQLARKDQIEADRYQELEKKMRKLQRKYNKISISNLHESSLSIGIGQQQRHSVEADPPMLIEEKYLKREDGPEHQAQSQKVIQTQTHYDQAQEASRQVVLTGPITTDRRGPNQYFRSLGVPAGLQEQQAQSHGLTGRSGASNDLRATSPAAGQANIDASNLNLIKSAKEKNQINFSVNQSSSFNSSAAAAALKSQLARSQAGRGGVFVHHYPSLQQSSTKQPEPCSNAESEQLAGDRHHFGAQYPSSPSHTNTTTQQQHGANGQIAPERTESENQEQQQRTPSGGPESDPVTAQRSGAPGTARTARAAIEAECPSHQYQMTNPAALSQRQALNGAATSSHYAHQKLHTIQSIGNEQEQSSQNINNSIVISSMPQTLQQPVEVYGDAGRVATGQSVAEDEGELEAQIKQMNGAIVKLAEEHRAQMEEMKQQCDQQIQQVRAECAAGASREASFAASLQTNYIHGVQAAAPIQYVSQEALARLMDQGKFQETMQQLTEAVGQKESLEQKLLRIKEKIQKAKQIKHHTIQASIPSTGSSLVPAGSTNPTSVNERMLSTAMPSVGLDYQTYRPPPQQLALSQYTNIQQSVSSCFQQAPPLPPSNGTQQVIRPPSALPRTEQSVPELQHSHSNSVQPSTCTATQYVSHHILEKAASSEDFERGLNFQYVSKNLKAGASQQSPSTVLYRQLQALPTGLPGAARTAAGAHKFIETFNPHSCSSSSIKPAQQQYTEQIVEYIDPVANTYQVAAAEGSYDSRDTRQTYAGEQVDNVSDVYLRDTTQSMMYVDLNSESQRNIMMNESKGINQKIVDLQRLRQEKEGQRASFYQGLQRRTGQNSAEVAGQQPSEAAGRGKAEDAASDYHNKDSYTFSKHHAANFGREALQPNVQVANARLNFHEASSSQQTGPKVTEFEENWKMAASQSLDARHGLVLSQSSARQGGHQHGQESLSLDEFAGSFEGSTTQLAAQHQQPRTHQTSYLDQNQTGPMHARHPSSGAGNTLATYQQVRQGHSSHISQAQSSVTHQFGGAGNLMAPAGLRGGAQTPMTEMHVLQHPSLFAPGHGSRFPGAAQELQSNLCISQLDHTDAMTEHAAAQYQGPVNGAPQTARSGQPFEAFQHQYYDHSDPRASAAASTGRHQRSQDHMGSSEAHHQYQQRPADQFQMMQEEDPHLSQPSSVSLSRKFLDSFTGRDGVQRQEYVQKIIQVQYRDNQQN